MKSWKACIFAFFLLLSFSGSAQDVHFSQFYMNPVYMNPALTGNFEGDWRFSANQRSQWRSVSRPFNTIALSAENKEELLLPGLYHGINLFHDAAGDGNFRTIEMNVSTAFDIPLDLDSAHTITPAVQIGFNHRRIDFTQLNFDNQFNGFYYDPDLPTMETFETASRTGLSLSLGVAYKWQIEPRKKIVAGLGWFNIPQAKQSFYGNELIERDRRVSFHAKGVYDLNFEWDLQPGLFMQFQGTYREIVFGSNVRYIYKDKKGEYIAPYAGLWFRNRDAIYAVVGAYYNNWIAGVSYDVNLSQLAPASNVRGGIEFSLQYMLHVFKPSNIQHRICPDYL